MTYFFRPGASVVTDSALARVYQAGGAANGLLNNLIAYWPGNEVAGNALDLHTNGLTLTDVNTVTSNPGLVYPLARQYTRANSEYHTRLGDDALLSTGDVDFTLAAWVQIQQKLPVGMGIAGKDNRVIAREYLLLYNTAADRFRAIIGDGGVGTNGVVDANSVGSPVLNTWYFIIMSHDSVANRITIQVDDGVIDTAATTGPGVDTAEPFAIGVTQGAPLYLDGRVGPTMFWKSAPGGGGVLTAAQRTALWNGGAGLTYAAFTL